MKTATILAIGEETVKLIDSWQKGEPEAWSIVMGVSVGRGYRNGYGFFALLGAFLNAYASASKARAVQARVK